jgi:hypothetical protein
MEVDIIEVTLSVEVLNKSVVANLTFRNKSERNIYANKQVMYYNGRVRNDYFEIRKGKDENVRYLGVMANCTRLPDEYIRLEPGGIIKSSISLEKSYELKEGEDYRIQYYAFNPSFQEEQQPLIEMQSNKVEISY